MRKEGRKREPCYRLGSGNRQTANNKKKEGNLAIHLVLVTNQREPCYTLGSGGRGVGEGEPCYTLSSSLVTCLSVLSSSLDDLGDGVCERKVEHKHVRRYLSVCTLVMGLAR